MPRWEWFIVWYNEKLYILSNKLKKRLFIQYNINIFYMIAFTSTAFPIYVMVNIITSDIMGDVHNPNINKFTTLSAFKPLTIEIFSFSIILNSNMTPWHDICFPFFFIQSKIRNLRLYTVFSFLNIYTYFRKFKSFVGDSNRSIKNTTFSVIY